MTAIKANMRHTNVCAWKRCCRWCCAPLGKIDSFSTCAARRTIANVYTRHGIQQLSCPVQGYTAYIHYAPGLLARTLVRAIIWERYKRQTGTQMYFLRLQIAFTRSGPACSFPLSFGISFLATLTSDRSVQIKRNENFSLPFDLQLT